MLVYGVRLNINWICSLFGVNIVSFSLINLICRSNSVHRHTGSVIVLVKEQLIVTRQAAPYIFRA